MGKFEDIRDAALDIMSERGVRALTLSLLFKRAKTGAGTFYHYYEDRDALVEEVYRHAYQVAMDELVVPDDSGAPTRQRFDALCEHMFHAYRHHPRELNFLYWYTFGYVEPDTDHCRIIPSIMMYTSVIAQAQREGLVPSSSSAAALARVVRGMVACAYWNYQHDIAAMDEEAARQFAGGAWAAIENF